LRTESEVFTELDAMLGRDVESLGDDELRSLIQDLQSHRVDSISVSRTETRKRASKQEVSGRLILKEFMEQTGKSEAEVLAFLKERGIM
jgi:uncharacterized protein YqeY